MVGKQSLPPSPPTPLPFHGRGEKKQCGIAYPITSSHTSSQALAACDKYLPGDQI